MLFITLHGSARRFLWEEELMDKIEEQNSARDLFAYLKKRMSLKQGTVTDIDKQEWRLFLSDLPVDESLVKVNFLGDEGARESKTGTDDRVLLSVQKPVFFPCPSVSDELAQWIMTDKWEDFRVDIIEVYANKTIASADGMTRVNFDELEAIKEEYESWIIQRQQWREIELKKNNVQELFDRLYKIYSQFKQDDESIDLMIGNGLFISVKDKQINHPILLKRVSIKYDKKDTMQILDSDEEPELYISLLSDLPNIRKDELQAIQLEILENDYHPMESDISQKFFQPMLGKLTTKGRFVEALPQNSLITDCYLLANEPVLFIRKKISGFAKIVDEIIADIGDNDEVPAPLGEILGRKWNICDDAGEKRNVNFIDEAEDILLVKEANEEQLRIAQSIEKYNALVVQGPPGTGKTHTIANLMGHFLAQGYSVLVTSATTKALKVLKEKLPHGIRDLCVSLLDESNKDMEQAVDGINKRIDSSDKLQMKKKINELKILRKDQIEDLSQLRDKLQKIKKQESMENIFVFDGKGYSLSAMGKYLHMHEGSVALIPGAIQKGAILPLGEDELCELYQSNALLSESDLVQLTGELPSLSKIPEVSIVVRNIEKLSKIEKKLHMLSEKVGIYLKENELWLDKERVVENFDRDKFELAKNHFLKMHREVREEDWFLDVILSGRKGGEYAAIWKDLNTLLDDVISLQARNARLLFNKTVTFSENLANSDEIIQELKGMAEAYGAGTKISMLTKILHPKWKNLCQSISVDGIPIHCAVDCEVAIAYMQISDQISKLSIRWNRLIGERGGLVFDVSDEASIDACIRYWKKVYGYLSWYKEEYEVLLSLLNDAGIHIGYILNKEIATTDREEVKTLCRWLSESASDYVEMFELFYIQYKDELAAYQHMGDALKTELDTVSYDEKIWQAYIDRNSREYAATYAKIEHLCKQQPIYKQRLKLLAKLAKSAPKWSEHIAAKQGVHGTPEPPGQLSEAWQAKQFQQFIEEIASNSPEELQQDINRGVRRLRETTAQLAKEKAWYYLLERTTQSMQQSLSGWRDLIRQIGKGTGKRAPRLIREARKQMRAAQMAVPAWIMPLSRVWQNINTKNPKFDIIIVDEASQADLSALALLYFGKRIIIVGDDQQVSPTSWEKDDEIEKFRKMYLENKVKNAASYTAEASLYSITYMFYQRLMLKEHFRCVPEIIGYSNNLAYNNEIEPLRESGDIYQPVISYRVNGRREETRQVNVLEARQIAAFFAACLEQPEYSGKTFGAITLLGNEQAEEIRQEVLEHIGIIKMEACNFLCGNSANFQGDERDIIFLSMVDSATGDEKLNKLVDSKASMSKRYNVAVSRARDQLWLIRSLDACNLKEDDLRRGLIEYAEDPQSSINRFKEAQKKSESPFEEGVSRALLAKSYHIEQQWPVAKYRIDIVAIYRGKKVAIECDGERYHSTDEQVANDLRRQSVLERMGWSFVRIRGSEYFRNPEKTIERVCKCLNDYGIYPEKEAVEKVQRKNELFERVKRLAQELLQEWDANAVVRRNLNEVVDKRNLRRKPVKCSSKERKSEIRVKVTEKQIIQPDGLGIMQVKEARPEIYTTALDTDIISKLQAKNFEVIDDRDKSKLIYVVSSETDKKSIEDIVGDQYNLWFEKKVKAVGNRSSYILIKK